MTRKYIAKRTLTAATFAIVCSLGGIAHGADGTNADNSEKNQRDANGQTLTPVDQSESKGDLKITQNIRKDVMKDDSLSVMAKNVKIITANGKVTLRGPVETAAEKATIAKYAQKVAGAKNVDNQLEVKTQ